jgi:uncharacterized phage protein (TIGR02220 family)
VPYAQLDDGFHDDPEIMALGNEGAGVIARAYSYCAHYLTDGKLPRKWLETAAKRGGIKPLISSGLVLEDGTDYALRDYLKHNPSREEVEARREAARQRKARQRASNESEVTENVPKVVTRDSTREDWSRSGVIEEKGLSSSGLTREQEIRDVFDYYVHRLDKASTYKLTGERKRKVNARLDEGYSVTDLQSAIDGVCNDEWAERRRSGNDDLSIVCRDATHVDRFLALAAQPKGMPGVRHTGWRFVRGTHSGNYVQDPNGIDPLPLGYGGAPL